VTDSFDRESSNSVEQTFTVVVVSFMVAPAEDAENTSCLSAFVVNQIRDHSRHSRATPSFPLFVPFVCFVVQQNSFDCGSAALGHLRLK
jgi:hypothetical protein